MSTWTHGIDCSNWQGKIQWQLVKQSGHEFAAIKATEGINQRDADIGYNWPVSRKAGLLRFAYHYLHPMYDGADQADFLHETIRNVGHFQNNDGVLLDFETLDNLTPHSALLCAESFIRRARLMIDKRIALYVSPGFWGIVGEPVSPVLRSCDVWVASWGSIAPPALANLSKPIYWQYSSTGVSPGIPDLVDLDIYTGDSKSLHKLLLNHNQ